MTWIHTHVPALASLPSPVSAPLMMVIGWMSLGFALAAAEAPVPGKVDYNHDVRPILSDLCFKCHGFDDKTREAGRRLDTLEGALANSDGVRAIVPGDLGKSDLHLRIHSTDKDDAMPPIKSGKKLTDRQKAILDKWIAQGAPYAKHWAFEPIKRAAVPSVKSGTKNPIDAFVQARLEKEGLAPSAEADPYTLCRRLYLDLIGVPPTPEEADRFVAAAKLDKEKAVGQLVDQLLASPKYGERWARKWLDLARYADTNGYEKDRPRSIWPWRDWVINALNAEMPFDQFTVEQLAGDMLPQPTPAQLIATGFNRNTMLNEEGGIDPMEFRFLAMTDRVATTGTTWMGLTIGCAQCHTHKYDPILHREYYQIMAFLNNADEPMYEIKPQGHPEEAAKTRAEIARLTAELPGKFKLAKGTPEDASIPVAERQRMALDKAFSKWLAEESAGAVQWTPLRPDTATSNLPLLTVQEDLSIFASGDQTKTDTYELAFRQPPKGITAIRVEALPDERLPSRGPGRVYYEGVSGDFTMTNFTAEADGGAQKFAAAAHSFATGKFTAEAAIDANLQSGWSINGGQGKAHAAVFKLAAPLANAEMLKLSMQFARHYSADLGRFRISVTTDPRGVFQASAAPSDIAQLLLLPAAQRTAAQREALFQHFLLVTPELEEARTEIAKLKTSLEVTATTLVMNERPPENPRPTHLHHRGEFLQPAEEVHPGVPSVLPPLPPGAAANRLAFSKWLVSKENPLTSRVTANRQWAALMGHGIVKTTEDFGLQGSPPTHPELLDWLAAEFMTQGWSLKKLHRLIVTSATYRQSSVVSAELQARDPQNVLLARGPRGRLDAEQVRDATLAAAGLLSPKMGGPSVYPPQPEGVSETAYGNPKWIPSPGEDRYRRGLYTFAKRTAPYAMFNTFDAPTGEACIARREVSNNPLQALTLLNDVAFVEAAQAMGKDLASQPQPVDERIQILFRRALTRHPSAEEVGALSAFFNKQKSRFEKDDSNAQKVAGEAKAGETKAGMAERAAWTVLARAIFNLDEAITRS